MTEDSSFQENVFLGGKISKIFPEYKDFAQLASFGFPWWFLKTIQDQEWKRKTSKQKISSILYVMGQLEFMNNSTEITKLSAIVGDQTRDYSSKELKNVLARIRNRGTFPASNSAPNP